MEIAIILLLVVVIVFSILNYITKPKPIEDAIIEDKNKISELEKSLAAKEETIKQYQQNLELANAKTSDFEQLKTQNITLRTKLESTETERNTLKTKNTTLENKEEARNEALSKSLDKSNTLQESLEKEKERVIKRKDEWEKRKEKKKEKEEKRIMKECMYPFYFWCHRICNWAICTAKHNDIYFARFTL